MVSTEKKFDIIANLYRELIRQFLILHKIKEVVCKDTKEHFFDRIVVLDDGTLNVYNHGLRTPWKHLYFDFTCDFAQCIAKMEHDLYLQERRGKHNNYDFTFNDEYEEPVLIDIKELEEECLATQGRL